MIVKSFSPSTITSSRPSCLAKGMPSWEAPSPKERERVYNITRQDLARSLYLSVGDTAHSNNLGVDASGDAVVNLPVNLGKSIAYEKRWRESSADRELP